MLNFRRSRRREWNLTTTKPSPKLSSTAVGATGAANGHISSDGKGVGVAGVGGGSVAGGVCVGLKPPKWLPDEDTASCSGCGRDFDWARRRVRVCPLGGERGEDHVHRGEARKTGVPRVVRGNGLFGCIHLLHLRLCVADMLILCWQSRNFVN